MRRGSFSFIGEASFIDEGGMAMGSVGLGEGNGPLDQMEAAGITVAFDLIRVHHSGRGREGGSWGRGDGHAPTS